jgi:hypothetical protein
LDMSSAPKRSSLRKSDVMQLTYRNAHVFQ